MKSSRQEVIALANDPRVFDCGGWSKLIVGEHPEPTPAMLAAAERTVEQARAYARAREESFARCDTDGFLTQYCDGILSCREQLRVDLLRQGGFDTFPALFNRHTGERVNARLIETQYGWCWAFLDERGRKTGRFIGDNRSSKRAKLYKEGFAVLGEWAPARAIIAGQGRGLSGTAWAATERCAYEDREGADLDAAAAA